MVAKEVDQPDPSFTMGYLRARNEARLLAMAPAVKPIVVRPPPSVHGDGDVKGLLRMHIDADRKAGRVALQGDNRWCAVHVNDAAHLLFLALERGHSGAVYHAVAEQGVAMKDVAAVIGRKTGLPVAQVSEKEAAKHFSFLATFIAKDNPASSEATQRLLDWHPTQPTLLQDLELDSYYAAPSSH